LLLLLLLLLLSFVLNYYDVVCINHTTTIFSFLEWNDMEHYGMIWNGTTTCSLPFHFIESCPIFVPIIKSTTTTTRNIDLIWFDLIDWFMWREVHVIKILVDTQFLKECGYECMHLIISHHLTSYHVNTKNWLTHTPTKKWLRMNSRIICNWISCQILWDFSHV